MTNFVAPLPLSLIFFFQVMLISHYKLWNYKKQKEAINENHVGKPIRENPKIKSAY